MINKRRKVRYITTEGFSKVRAPCPVLAVSIPYDSSIDTLNLVFLASMMEIQANGIDIFYH